MTEIKWQPGIDFEVYGKRGGPYPWHMFYRDKELDAGIAKTRFGLAVALWRRKILFDLGIGKPAAIVRSMR